MSPEQARGESSSARSDLFSFGAVLYHAATGKRPFDGTSVFAVLDAIVTLNAPPPSVVRLGIPPAFDALLGRLMAKRVEDLQLKMSRGNLDQAALAGDTAIALARSFGDVRRLRGNLCARARLHYYRAEYESALTQLREACSSPGAETRRQADPRPRYAHFSGVQFLGLTLVDLGRISEALSILQSELEIARTDGYGYWVPILLNAIGCLYREIGDVDAALSHAEEASRETVGQNTEVGVESQLIMAAACSRLGHLDRAASLLAEADRLTKQGILHEWLIERGGGKLNRLPHGAPSGKVTGLPRPAY
jgi:tetratricopeptide (TPR) repeat protein